MYALLELQKNTGGIAMNIGVISGSNVSTSGSESISIKTCETVVRKLAERRVDHTAEVVDLRDYDLRSCRMCEGCSEDLNCPMDPDFNSLWNKVRAFDGLIIVCPHYAPIPSKLIIMLEKFEELFYIQYCTGKGSVFPLAGKKVGIIAHGGMTEGYEKLYYENMLRPLTNVFCSMGMKVVNAGSEKTLCFGAVGYENSETKVTPDILHDFARI